MIHPLLISSEEEYDINLEELAKELNVPAADVLAYLSEDLGEITGDFVLTAYDKFVDIERDFIEVAAKELKKPNLVDSWAKDKLKAEAELRAALDKAAKQNIDKTAYKTLNTKYNRSIVNTLQSHEVIYERAYKEDLILFKPHNLSESDMVKLSINQGYKDCWDVMDKVVLTGREDVVTRLEKAVTDISYAGDSYSGAIRRAMEDMTDMGITGHVYSSGNRISMAPYVRREIMNGITKVSRTISFERAQEWGSDLIQVTAHAGARPLCYPYQGRVFSVSGQHDKYMSLYDTSYGEPAGLFGINCRHWFFPFFEGLNTEYTEDEMDPASAVPGGPPNDQIYEATQIQRYNERQIRKWKLKEAGYQGLEPGSPEAVYAKKKVKVWQKRNREFIQEMNDMKMDLRRDYLREKV
jgi:hypothetical protein